MGHHKVYSRRMHCLAKILCLLLAKRRKKEKERRKTMRSVVKSGTENEERGFFTMENMKSNYSIRVLENDKLYVELTDVMD